MPGGRLTYQDREQIEEGLDEGLSHAEIARRLDRPTSTVSREVQRNGGHAGYRAQQAHSATERRAQRRTSRAVATAAAQPESDNDSGRDPEAVRKYQDWLTAVLVEMGLSRMTASVITCLAVTDSGSLTAAELVQRLRVSPASISKAVSYLEEQGLVRRERSERRERYIFDDDAWLRAWMVSARTNAMLAGAALQGADILGQTTPAGARMAQMGNFLRLVGDDMIRAAEHWWRIVTVGEGGEGALADGLRRRS
ncbi:MAG TPA: helix-turn-helix domain-containing protein [Streptosporangiaceae bacterium]|jgi:DNA-binding transcriptional ArsR family regulator|nr:helix-turn-helix domain-containing protein [Streptosporangiaceae bacterium]